VSDATIDIAIFASYFLVLLVLVALPLLARWRWGLMASLTVTVAELGLVLFFAYDVYRSPPPGPPMPEPPMPERGRDPFTGGRPGTHAEGFARTLAVLFLVTVPAIAALIGGVASLVWSAVRARRRSEADRQTPET
jgi:hypothetical protein